MNGFLIKTFIEYLALGLTISYSVIWPLERGLSLSQVGVIQAVLFISSMLFEIPTGLYADKFSKRNSLAIGLLFSSVGLFIISTGFSFATFLIGAMMAGIGRSFVSGAEESYIKDVFTNINLKKFFKENFSKINVTRETALFFGALISSYVVYISNIKLVFQIAFILMLLGSLLTVFVLPRDIIRKDLDHKPIEWGFSNLSVYFKKYNKFLLIFMSLAMLFESARTLWQPQFINIGWSKESLGLIFAAIRIFSISGFILSRKIEMLSPKAIYISAVFGGLMLLLFSVPHKIVALIFLGGYLFFESFLKVHQTDFLLSIAPSKSLKSTFLSSASLVKSLFLSVSGPLLLIVVDKSSIYITLLILFMIKIIFVVVLRVQLKTLENRFNKIQHPA